MIEDINNHFPSEDFFLLRERRWMLFRDAEIIPCAPVMVLSPEGKRLSPCFRNGHVRKLLRSGLAVVEHNSPFTIRLLYSKKIRPFWNSPCRAIDAYHNRFDLDSFSDDRLDIHIFF